MLYFSKLRITLVSLVSIFFIFIAASNFQNPEDSFISKKINLGLDLQGGSYLLLEIDNEPVEIQKLQNTTTVIRNFLKDKKISFNDLRIKDKKIMRVQDLQEFLSKFTEAKSDGSRQGNAISNAIIMVEVNGYLEKITKMEVHENNTPIVGQTGHSAHRLVLKTTKKSNFIIPPKLQY